MTEAYAQISRAAAFSVKSRQFEMFSFREYPDCFYLFLGDAGYSIDELNKISKMALLLSGKPESTVVFNVADWLALLPEKQLSDNSFSFDSTCLEVTIED
jgi:hypothetical protein